MAATLASSASLAVDSAWSSRVAAAVDRQAVTLGKAILGAQNVSGADKARLALAVRVLVDPQVYGNRFAWALACDAAVDSTATDTTIADKVAAVWDLIAGIPV
jgi:hypothetical protein